MLFTRRSLLAGAAVATALPMLPRLARAEGTGVSEMLRAALSDPANCGAKGDAIRATLERLSRTRPPTSGRSIVVDLPSQTLTAYEAATPSFESVVVVGDPGWQTPDLDTTVAFVRFNPTWTVPQSIVEARGWRRKLSSNPGYFERLNFEVMVGGRMMTPEEASDRAGAVSRFVQQSGPNNALGRCKIGLNAGEAIYLHDTNDKGAFDEDARALSHGCVRVEQAVRLGAWALGLGEDEARRMVEDGDDADRRPQGAIRMATTYFTAWPDASGKVVFYADVYERDRDASRGCSSGRRSIPVEVQED